MPSIINSDDGQTSGSAGLKFTSGDDGVMKIQNNGVDAMTVSAAGVTTFASQPVVPVPLFKAIPTANQNITSGVWTKVTLDNVLYDTNSYFDGTTNYRYTPQIPGYYQFHGYIRNNSSGLTTVAIDIYKNGSSGQEYRAIFSTPSAVGTTVTSVMYMNGSTDYVELYGYITGTSPYFHYVLDSSSSFFEGFLVRAA